MDKQGLPVTQQGADIAIGEIDMAAAREVANEVEALGSKGIKATGASVDIMDGDALKAWVKIMPKP